MAASPDDVLSFWFSGGVADSVRGLWFVAHGSQRLAELDADIAARFGPTLEAAVAGQLSHWTETTSGTLALIVVLDQFSRHVWRGDAGAERRAAADAAALPLAEELAGGCSAAELSVEQALFALMPLRHSGDPARVERALALAEQREAQERARLDLLGRFRRAGTKQLQHLQGSHGDEADILERAEVPGAADAPELASEPVFSAVTRFLLPRRPRVVAVSLSGGVDSMVLAECVVQAQRRGLLPAVERVVAVHIDYANRPESGAEAAFVAEWCARRGVECRVRVVSEVTRGQTRRDEYERVSREARYGAYRDAMAATGCEAVLFGHHQGDVRENVITNAVRGAGPLRLSGMTAESTNSGVRVWRPLLAFEKDAIFALAHRFGVPYFRDTTPQWSSRGRMRRELLPLMADMFGDGFARHLSALAQQSDELRELPPFAAFRAGCRRHGIAVALPARAFAGYPLVFWREVLAHVCHEELGVPTLKERALAAAVAELRQFAAADGLRWLNIKKDSRALLADGRLIVFRGGLFPHAVDGRAVLERPEGQDFGAWRVSVAPEPAGLPPPGAGAVVSLDDVLSGDVSYVLPASDTPLVVSNRARPAPLHGVDEFLTRLLPVVTHDTPIKWTAARERGEGAVRVRVVFRGGRALRMAVGGAQPLRR